MHGSSVDIIATASGKIIPTGRTKVIQPLESGVVHAIHVQDGQQVKVGEVLIEIDTTVSAAERDRLKNDCLQAMLDSARLKAALNLDSDPVATFVAPEGATDTQIIRQKSMLANLVDEMGGGGGGGGGGGSREAQRSRSPDCPEHRQQGCGRLDHHQADRQHPLSEETRRCPQIPAR